MVEKHFTLTRDKKIEVHQPIKQQEVKNLLTNGLVFGYENLQGQRGNLTALLTGQELVIIDPNFYTPRPEAEDGEEFVIPRVSSIQFQIEEENGHKYIYTSDQETLDHLQGMGFGKVLISLLLLLAEAEGADGVVSNIIASNTPPMKTRISASLLGEGAGTGEYYVTEVTPASLQRLQEDVNELQAFNWDDERILNSKKIQDAELSFITYTHKRTRDPQAPITEQFRKLPGVLKALNPLTERK